MTAKCRRCREKAVIELPRHNAAFCKPCFLTFFRRQVERAIHDAHMLEPDDHVLVAVSGGKDSLALWDVLLEAGYRTTGFHIVLWTGEEYAPESLQVSQAFADDRGVELRVCDLRERYGFAVPELAKLSGRATCGACGLAKRHLIAEAAAHSDVDAIAIGHNLDDEAAVLLGNVLRWDADYLGRQSPNLPAANGFVKKVKPLHRLSEKETAAYAFLRGIDYQVDECPLVDGNTQLRYKEALDTLERKAPGTKASFYLSYLDHGHERFADEEVVLGRCGECGMPTPQDVCAFCRMVAQVEARS